MPTNQPTANRLTHEQVKSVCPGSTDKERECPLCGGKLSLYSTDGILCCNPQPCDMKAVAAKIHELREAKKARPSQTADWTGLNFKQYCEAKHLPAAWIAMHYTADLFRNETPMERLYKSKPVVDFAYMDQDRKVIFTRFRESMTSRPYSEAGSKMSIPYGLWLRTNKPDAVGNWPRAVVVCEGESDQQTLTVYGIPALGIPGVNNWKPEWANLPVLRYAEKIFVVQEPTKEGKADAGKKFVETVTASFPAGKVVSLNLAANTASKAKDPSELHTNIETAKEWEEPFLKQLGDAVHRANPTADWRKYFHKLSELDQGKVKELVKGVIPEGVTFLGSLAGVGKTWVGVSLARSLVFCKPFLGVYEVTEQHNVLYLVPEMGSHSFRTRLEKMGLPDDDRFRCQTLKDGFLPLDSSHLLAAVREQKPVVFLDTAIRFAAGAEENSSTANASGLANAIFALLREGAVAVICLHHSPKVAAEADFMTLENVLRGTGDFGAMCDAVWGIQHAKQSGKGKDYQQESSELTRLFLKCVKSRDIEVVDPFVIQGRPYIDEVGDFRVIRKGDLTMRSGDEADKTEQLVGLVTENAEISLRELMRKTGLHNDTVKNRLAGRGWKLTADNGWRHEESSEDAVYG